MEEFDNLYKTTNFHIAVWLMMNRVELKKIDWGDKRAEFIFEDFENREAFVDQFFEQEQLQNFISSSQELKSRMYAIHSPKIYGRHN